MSKGLTVEIVTRDFNRMLRDLTSIDTAIEFRSVVKHEAGKVVESSLRYTKAAQVQKIREASANREWVTYNGKKYNVQDWRMPDPLWAQINRFRRARLETKLAARGLGKQSWLHMVREISEQIKFPAFVDRANYRGKQYPVDADSREEGTSSNYALTIINSSPVMQYAGGQSVLIRAINGRTRYFRRNMEHHAFRTLATRARAYPGIWTSPVPTKAD